MTGRFMKKSNIKTDLIKKETGNVYQFTLDAVPGVSVTCRIPFKVFNGLEIYCVKPKNWRQKSGLEVSDIYDIVCPQIMQYIISPNKENYIYWQVEKYAREVLSNYSALREGMEKFSYKKFKFNIGYFDSIEVTPVLDGDSIEVEAILNDNNSKFEDVKYYKIEDKNIEGISGTVKSIWKVASNSTPTVYEEVIKTSERFRDWLMDMYINKILPIEFIPYDKISPEYDNELCQRYVETGFSDTRKRQQFFEEFMARGEMEKEYVEFVKGRNASGKECPTSFEDYKKEREMIEKESKWENLKWEDLFEEDTESVLKDIRAKCNKNIEKQELEEDIER